MNKILKVIVILLIFGIISIPLVSLGSEKLEKRDKKEIRKDKDSENYKNFSKKDKKAKNYKENQVIVKYKEDKIDLTKSKGKEKAENFENNKKLESEGEIKKLNAKLLKSKDNKKTTEKLIEELENDSDVEYVEPNYIIEPAAYTPNDTDFVKQWGLNNIAQAPYYGVNDADIDAPEAWEIENAGGEVIIAIIDTGVRYTHEDLANNMWDGSVECYDENNNPISGGCLNHGWDFENGDDEPTDDNGHGTFIAGIIAGESGNAKGVSGMSRYNDIKIMPIRFDYTIFGESLAINFAKNNGAQIINASYGGHYYSQFSKDNIEAFPGIFVACAMNDDENVDEIIVSPCGYNSENIICVAATDEDDDITGFSNYGLTSVDIAAPGYDIFSAGYEGDSDYIDYGMGTSYAAPYVAGATALAMKQFPAKNLSEIKELVIESGDTLNYLDEYVYKGKRLNLYNVLSNSVPPVISNEYPDDNTLSPTTTNIQFTLNTDKDATCRYSENWGVDYDSMTKTFSTTGGTSHSTNVSGLTSDNYYTYYVRCSDKSGNKNGSDFLIEFGTDELETFPLYRFWSDVNQGHFYTASETEKNNVINNYPDNVWKYENVAYYVFNSQIKGTTPIYRFWSDVNQGHFYTASETEKNNVINNYPDNVWKYEGIAYYTYGSSQSNTKPVYRFWSDLHQHHFYTASETEKNNVINNYSDDVWKYEGIAWYVEK